MSRILDETKTEIEELYNLGIVSADDCAEVVKSTARDINILAPIAYEGQKQHRLSQEQDNDGLAAIR
jgi:hypothetical protein